MSTFSINRNSTYLLRLFLDECLPPFLRDNKYFMYPFFYVWFKGKNVRNIMEFKSNFHKYTEKEFRTLYKELDCFAKDRPTDLNTISLQYMIDHLDPHASSVLDVGCGRGKFLKKVQEKGYRTAGCDLYHDPLLVCDDFFESNAEELPFADKTFDIVTCSHTLEHTRNLHRAVSELKRITIKQLMVTVPCQRYHDYTLDLHLNFFPEASYLINEFSLPNYTCKKIMGDWTYIATLS